MRLSATGPAADAANAFFFQKLLVLLLAHALAALLDQGAL